MTSELETKNEEWVEVFKGLIPRDNYKIKVLPIFFNSVSIVTLISSLVSQYLRLQIIRHSLDEGLIPQQTP